MSSGLDTIRQAIEGRIQTLWVTAPGVPRTTIAWPNRSFNPPASGGWIAVNILWGDGAVTAMGVGTGVNRVPGVLSVDVFTKPNAGRGTMDVYADQVRDMVSRVGLTGVQFGAPSGPKRIPREDAAWAQVNVSCSFYVDEVGV